MIKTYYTVLIDPSSISLVYQSLEEIFCAVAFTSMFMCSVNQTLSRKELCRFPPQRMRIGAEKCIRTLLVLENSLL